MEEICWELFIPTTNTDNVYHACTLEANHSATIPHECAHTHPKETK